ncbi:MAG: ArdC-like ssDNA-binding domain-containing protein [Fusobacterium sp.]|nr:ArdC-like ssDNA-binding domain-containing protein [Fusobacterium sp.]MDO5789094.1 ArdC-like ssDNA-binding domain-containing protein [Fusobacterium sp.]
MENKEFMKIIEELKEGIDEKIKDFLENSQELKDFIEFRKNNFYEYSIRNNILIYKQDKTATMVAGFKKWQELGYNIKKGAKAIKILVPLISKRKNEGKEEEYVYGYRYANVFDIKNTIPTEKAISIPNIDTRMRVGKSKYKITELFKNSKEIVEQYLPVNIVKELYCKGLTDGKSITIRKDKFVAMSGTLMHEFTHYLNHFEKEKSQNQEEVEAELGAMLYGSYFNLDISGKYKYIALWKNKDVRLDEAFDVALSSFEQLLYGTPNTKGLIELERNCN